MLFVKIMYKNKEEMPRKLLNFDTPNNVFFIQLKNVALGG